jgi:hypothetical protein
MLQLQGTVSVDKAQCSVADSRSFDAYPDPN